MPLITNSQQGKKVLTEATKQKIREARMKWLSANPEKHPWKSKNKFKSVPCENLKELIQKEGISFAEEYSPFQDYHISIDIAFPDKKIGLEVNGNQHYNRAGQLTKYYQNRHDRLTSAGWLIYEIHYSCCFTKERIIPIITEIIASPILLPFDYLTYVPLKKKVTLCACGNIMSPASTKCQKCETINRNKNTPLKEQLMALIWEKPTVQIAKQFGVSDKAVEKWCKKYDISKPPRGYWTKAYRNKQK